MNILWYKLYCINLYCILYIRYILYISCIYTNRFSMQEKIWCVWLGDVGARHTGTYLSCDYHYLNYHVIMWLPLSWLSCHYYQGWCWCSSYWNIFIHSKDKKTKIHEDKKTKIRVFYYCDVSTLLMFLCLSLSIAISRKIWRGISAFIHW